MGVGSSGGAGGRMRCAEATTMRRNHHSQLPTPPFSDARAVAAHLEASGSTLLAVADLGEHRIRLLGLRGFAVVSTRTPCQMTRQRARTAEAERARSRLRQFIHVNSTGGQVRDAQARLRGLVGRT